MNLVLCYHHVSPWRRLCATPPEIFERHLTLLRRAGYALIGFDEMTERLNQPGRDAKRTALVSFDDGHLDNWLHARPVLAAHGAPAVMFAISADVAQGPVRETGDLSLAPPDTEDTPVRLRWSELRAWAAGGALSVQSHTHSHCNWRLRPETGLIRSRALARDLIDSATLINAHMGGSVRGLAWPWGYSDAAMRRTALEVGLRWQFSVVPGVDRAPVEPGRALHRVVADGMSPDAFTSMLARYRVDAVAHWRSQARRWFHDAQMLIR